jgi:phosphoglycolate phosphatase
LIILFDLDGTLIDSTEAILESFHHTFKIHNISGIKSEDIEPHIGYPLDIMCQRMGVADNIVWDCVATYKEYYREISTQKTLLLDGAREAIIKAHEFATLGIVTTKTAQYSKILMEHFSLMSYFEVLIGREDVLNPKPHAQPILMALQRINKKDKDIWMIGDTNMDMQSAASANVNSIAVLCGYEKKESLEKYTDLIFSDTLAAVNYLKNM